VLFVAGANTSSSPRAGTLTIASQTYTVTQAGAPCSYVLTPGSSGLIASTGATGSFDFSTTATGCSPLAVSYSSWVTVSTGSSSVNYTVAANATAATRGGTIQLGDQTFTVTQSGAACAYSLNAYGASFNRSGGTGSVLGSQNAVGCTPTVGTSQPTIVSLGTLTGPVLNIWTLPYTVLNFSSTTTAIRRAYITFGGQIFTVKQTSW
jgi:hypothetical protein